MLTHYNQPTYNKGYQVQWIVIGEKGWAHVSTCFILTHGNQPTYNWGRRLGARMCPLHDTSKVITYEMEANPILLVA
jgi:hypothetical protein